VQLIWVVGAEVGEATVGTEEAGASLGIAVVGDSEAAVGPALGAGVGTVLVGGTEGWADCAETSIISSRKPSEQPPDNGNR